MEYNRTKQHKFYTSKPGLTQQNKSVDFRHLVTCFLVGKPVSCNTHPLYDLQDDDGVSPIFDEYADKCEVLDYNIRKLEDMDRKQKEANKKAAEEKKAAEIEENAAKKIIEQPKEQKGGKNDETQKDEA